jgi:hypothetical protein
LVSFSISMQPYDGFWYYPGNDIHVYTMYICITIYRLIALGN